MESSPDGPGGLSPSIFRPTAEFLAILMIGVLVARTFAAEAYIVPTGSMAPTLLGMHRDYTCGNCGFRFALGTDEDGRGGRPVCPNCGLFDPERFTVADATGDRLLVQKYLFDLRDPQRWEAAVFQNPADTSQAYVKRIVGLPGEAVEIQGGEVYIDGRIARKSLDQQRALRILVYDHDHAPADSDRFPRWLFRPDGPSRFGPGSSWRLEETRLLHEPNPDLGERTDWVTYHHWQADANHYGPIKDFIAYNGLDLPGENRVDDLTLVADVAVSQRVRQLRVRLTCGGDRFQVLIPAASGEAPEVRRNGRAVAIASRPTAAEGMRRSDDGRTQINHIEASLVDRRLSILLNGEPLFEPIDYDDPRPTLGFTQDPVAVGVTGAGWASLSGVKIYRDVYYTDALAGAPRRPFGVGEPYGLGPGEYFVLGDNSPVSNDSRFWPESPVVPRSLLVGKPFLVHLPSQAVPLQVFGHELYWIPDPREIRYIR